MLAAFISALVRAWYHKLQVSFYNERLNTMTICPSHRAKLGIVSSRSCSTRGRVTVRKRGVAKKWKRTGEKGIWNYLTRDWFACKSWIRWVLYSLVVYPNISQVIDGSLTLLFVLIKVYVERERGNRRLRARCLTYFCYDILISIMISMLAAVRDLAHWEPVSVRFVNRNSGTEPHFLLPWLRAIFHSLQTALACC